MVAQNVAFGLIAVVMIVAAVRVVTTTNMVHAALWLVAVLAGAAAQYILLIAEFTAIVQVLVYIGAIVVLFLFGIMLTRAPLEGGLKLDRSQMVMGGVVAIALFALLSFVVIDSWGDDEIDLDTAYAGATVAAGSNTKTISDSIFSDYIIPFEAISVLLLAALIGAIVLARKE